MLIEYDYESFYANLLKLHRYNRILQMFPRWRGMCCVSRYCMLCVITNVCQQDCCNNFEMFCNTIRVQRPLAKHQFSKYNLSPGVHHGIRLNNSAALLYIQHKLSKIKIVQPYAHKHTPNIFIYYQETYTTEASDMANICNIPCSTANTH